MITCKEGLINTYIENDRGELRDLYLAKCESLGFSSRTERAPTSMKNIDATFFGITSTDEALSYSIEWSFADNGCKKITLSDLRPAKQCSVLHKGGSYSFQSDKPIGGDVVACFDLVHSESPLSEDFFDENRQDDKKMKTYNTYQEAKIANPECAIFEYLDKFGTDKDILDTFDIHSLEMKECNPAEYCMTVEEFLKSGNEFKVGDLYLTSDGRVEDVHNDEFAGVMNSDCADGIDNKRYILRAAALEKPKRTKVEYEKVEYEPNEIWKAFKEHQEVGYLYVNTSDGFECLLDGVFNLAIAISQGDQLYRRTETPMTEREAFIEECQKYGSWGEMYDSGKFKLVN